MTDVEDEDGEAKFEGLEVEQDWRQEVLISLALISQALNIIQFSLFLT